MVERSESVSFDRAADFYDNTRKLPSQVAEAQSAQLLEALRDVDGQTLEIGIGTGRVAIPLVTAGQRIVGVDLSFAMLARLREKSPDQPPLVQADAALLPFRDGAFGGAVVAHVLHLVSDWRVVLAELRRVVRPGGVLLVTRGAPRAGLHAEITRRARSIAGWTMPAGRLDGLDPLDDYIRSVGGAVSALAAIPTDAPSTAEEDLQAIESNLMSWTWGLTEETRTTAAREVREWVTQTYGDPAAHVIPSPPLQWRCYRLPAA